MSFFNRLERKIGRFAIPNLMLYIIIAYIIGYILLFANPTALSYLTLEPYAIIHGQIWRLVSWVIVPPGTSIIFAVIMMFFYYSLGRNLENAWGTFRFNLYIFGGIIFTIIGAFILFFINGGGPVLIGSYFSTYYINMSIFLAFAVAFPNMQVMLWFIIPIKMKWMALVYAAIMGYTFFRSNGSGKMAIVMSLLNFLIFFLVTRNYQKISPKEIHRKKKYKEAVNNAKVRRQTISKHKCAICGRTPEDDPTLTFRFCSKCNGNYEYCQEHLFTHKHIIR